MRQTQRLTNMRTSRRYTSSCQLGFVLAGAKNNNYDNSRNSWKLHRHFISYRAGPRAADWQVNRETRMKLKRKCEDFTVRCIMCIARLSVPAVTTALWNTPCLGNKSHCDNWTWNLNTTQPNFTRKQSSNYRQSLTPKSYCKNVLEPWEVDVRL